MASPTTPPSSIAGSSSTALATSARRTLVALVACHAINDFYSLVIPPLLPAFRAGFGLSYSQAGVIPFVVTAVSAVFQPVLGYVADRRMLRVPFLVAGFATLAIAMVLLGASGSYLAIIIAAALLGLGGSTYHAQSATLLAHTFDRRRGWAQGIHGIGNGLGFMVAPLAASALMVLLGWRGAAIALAVPAIFAGLIAITTLAEPPIRGSTGLLAGVSRPLVLLTLVNGTAMGLTTSFVTWLPSFYRARGEGEIVAGVLTAVMTGVALVAQPIGGTVSDRFGRREVVLASMGGTGLFQVGFLLADWFSLGLAVMVVATVLIGFWSSLMPPVIMVYASEIAAGQRTGTAVGVVWGLGTLVGSVAPLLSGIVIDHYGFAVTYAVLAVGTLVTAVVALALLRGPKLAGPK